LLFSVQRARFGEPSTLTLLKHSEFPATHTSSFQLDCISILFFRGERGKKCRAQKESTTMRPAENLRKAEEKSVSTIRQGIERAREEWADVERKIRKRMRIYPQKARTMAAAPPSLEQDITDVS
jgi:hypothetical protein